MSKSLEDVLLGTDQPNQIKQELSKKDSVVKDQTNQTNSDTDKTKEVKEFPDYMFTDSGMVGYFDSTIQEDIYNLSIRGTLPLMGNTKILDVGCGRGDFLLHVQRRLPNLSIEYEGVDANEVLVQVGNQKLSQLENAEIHLNNYLDQKFEDKFNYTFLIGTLNLDYGSDLQPWENLELMLRKALDDTIQGGKVTLILLNDNGGVDEYLAYPIPNLTDTILKFGFPFELDYGKIPSVYKITIEKNPIFITEQN